MAPRPTHALLFAACTLGCTGRDAARSVHATTPAPTIASAAPAVAPATPYSAHATPLPVDAPVVVLDARALTLDGVEVAPADALVRDAPLAKLPALHDALRATKARWIALHRGEDFAGVVVVRAAATTPLAVVRTLVHTIALVGYPWSAFPVRTGDGAREGVLTIGAELPTLGGPAPRWLAVDLDERSIALAWRPSGPSAWTDVRPRSLLHTPGPRDAVAPALVAALREAWRRGAPGPRPRGWLIALRDHEELGTLLLVADAIAAARADAPELGEEITLASNA